MPFLAADIAGTQNVPLDEGRFVILRNGERVGTESFWIRSAGSGPDARVIAKGEISLELPGARRDIALALEMRGRDMTLSAYEVKVSGDQQQEVAGRVVGRRFSARVVTAGGEQLREFPAGPETFVLDPGVAHQYYFIARLRERAPVTVPVIEPQDGRHTRMRLSVVGVEPVTVGGIRIEAHHLRIDDPDGGEHHVWIGPAGQVLRVEVPARGYAAEREAPPADGSPEDRA